VFFDPFESRVVDLVIVLPRYLKEKRISLHTKNPTHLSVRSAHQIPRADGADGRVFGSYRPKGLGVPEGPRAGSAQGAVGSDGRRRKGSISDRGDSVRFGLERGPTPLRQRSKVDPRGQPIGARSPRLLSAPALKVCQGRLERALDVGQGELEVCRPHVRNQESRRAPRNRQANGTRGLD
jgi:hypothetical protein